MKTKALLALALSLLLPLSAVAQTEEKRFAFELNGGPSFPTVEIAEGIRMGFGFECTFLYKFMPHTGIYGGWGANWLSSESVIAEDNLDFEETGYVLGLDFRHPVNNSGLSYYVRAGVLYNHIEIENTEGDIINDTKHGPGYQIAGGFDISLKRNWSLTPGLKFNSLSREYESEGTPEEIDYKYISVRIGVAKKF